MHSNNLTKKMHCNTILNLIYMDRKPYILMIEDLFELSRKFLKIKNSPYKRYLIRTTKFAHRMSVIIGQRGVGKTTTLVQLLLKKTKQDPFDERILYVQSDHFLVGSISLYEIAERFLSMGGKWLAIDEIHKYKSWSKELKSIYDTFPDLGIFVSGSSALEIYRGSHDLSRRSACYLMQGLSFREFLELKHDIKLPTHTLEKICKNHEKITEDILEKVEKINKKVLPEFYEYLKIGYYPYFFELKNEEVFQMTLEQNLHATIESDLAAIYPKLTGSSINKIKQLLTFIAGSVPFVPNWNKIRNVLEIGDLRTLKTYVKYLEDACLIKTITKATNKFSRLESQAKIFLDNPNQLFAISSESTAKGTIRETFFLNQVSMNQKVRLPKNGDFFVNNLLFEIGGRSKSFHQVKSDRHSYVVCDDIERGRQRKIPLWLFGFLY